MEGRDFGFLMAEGRTMFCHASAIECISGRMSKLDTGASVVMCVQRDPKDQNRLRAKSAWLKADFDAVQAMQK
eukprot:8130327-Karenia_brevis.AAC.1